MDRDNDGLLTLEEFAAGLRSGLLGDMDTHPSDEFISELFSSMDFDEAGHIDFDKFHAWIEGSAGHHEDHSAVSAP